MQHHLGMTIFSLLTGCAAHADILENALDEAKSWTHSNSYKKLKNPHQRTNARKAHSNAASFSSADFPAAMAQMRTPNTALATTSAIEYPTCSYVVATVPARPMFLMMYTKG